MLFHVKRRWWTALLTANLLVLATLPVGFRGPCGRLALLPLLGGLALLLLLTRAIHRQLLARDGPAHAARLTALGQLYASHTAADRWAVALLAAAEELFFRGLLQLSLQRLTGSPRLAVAVTALLFAGLHDQPDRRLRPLLLPVFVEGVLLGGLYVVTRSLPVVMLVHAVHDLWLCAALVAGARGERSWEQLAGVRGGATLP
ncbi:MAG: CPBP family intramembrane metalloprotease [Fimbriimonadaceae bacterium]|nr:CPBP family intramembrane metalloprotease [Fimbriimonadaceae bacterium]